MAPLLAQVLPLAAGAAISPAMLGLQVLNVSRARNPLAWAWSVALGVALLLVVATAAALLFHIGTGGHKASPELKGVVKLVAAVVLLGVGIYEVGWGSGAPPKSRVPSAAEGAEGAGVHWAHGGRRGRPAAAQPRAVLPGRPRGRRLRREPRRPRGRPAARVPDHDGARGRSPAGA